MTTLFIILIVLASVVLGLIVLVQNPKGGGLAGNIAGFSNQFMGVKQTTDVLEKGTWIFAGVIGALCLLSVLFISGGKSGAGSSKATEAPVPANSQAPGTLTLPNTTPATNPGTTPGTNQK
ncbi:MAG: preprotein translocase subunit SecG [Chitinophagaceae bacterium]